MKNIVRLTILLLIFCGVVQVAATVILGQSETKAFLLSRRGENPGP